MFRPHSHPRGGVRFSLPFVPGRRRYQSLFSGPPKPPAPPPPTPMPDLMDPAILAERKRTLQEAAGRSGRASTMLSSNNDYTNTKLGTA